LWLNCLLVRFSFILYDNTWILTAFFFSMLSCHLHFFPNVLLLLCHLTNLTWRDVHSSQDLALHAHNTSNKGNYLLWLMIIKVILKLLLFIFKLSLCSLIWLTFIYGVPFFKEVLIWYNDIQVLSVLSLNSWMSLPISFL
jgi:hypothetical protein